MQSIGQRVRHFSTELSKPTDSDVVHLRTLRGAIGILGLALPWTLALGENIRDRYCRSPRRLHLLRYCASCAMQAQ